MNKQDAVQFRERWRIANRVISEEIRNTPLAVKAKQIAASFGIVPRRAGALQFAKERRVLLLEHQATGIGIDISFGALPFESEMIQRSKTVELGGIPLRVATPEDVIIMKMIAHRAKDLRDIDNIM